MEGDFRRALSEFVKGRQNVPMQLAKVTKVETTTCDVLTINEDEIFDIRLRTIDNGNTDGMLLKPALQSWVLIADIGSKQHDYIVVAYEKLESVSVKIGTTKIEVNTEGVKIMRGTESLKTVLNDVLNKVKTLQILTTTGTATVLPSEIPLIEVLKTRLNTILK
jgi:hypothetical protein